MSLFQAHQLHTVGQLMLAKDSSIRGNQVVVCDGVNYLCVLWAGC